MKYKHKDYLPSLAPQQLQHQSEVSSSKGFSNTFVVVEVTFSEFPRDRAHTRTKMSLIMFMMPTCRLMSGLGGVSFYSDLMQKWTQLVQWVQKIVVQRRERTDDRIQAFVLENERWMHNTDQTRSPLSLIGWIIRAAARVCPQNRNNRLLRSYYVLCAYISNVSEIITKEECRCVHRN